MQLVITLTFYCPKPLAFTQISPVTPPPFSLFLFVYGTCSSITFTSPTDQNVFLMAPHRTTELAYICDTQTWAKTVLSPPNTLDTTFFWCTTAVIVVVFYFWECDQNGTWQATTKIHRAAILSLSLSLSLYPLQGFRFHNTTSFMSLIK